MNISDRLKYKCYEELATVKFHPQLNLKSTEETVKIHKKKDKKQEALYINVVEELNDFDEWCISEEGVWGIPIPFFERKSGGVLASAEIARHVADIFKEEGSDAWYSKSVEELLPPRY
jgi:isoleucyl-tRNA synthetase